MGEHHRVDQADPLREPRGAGAPILAHPAHHLARCAIIGDMERPRCSVFIATSADGYIARKDGAIDWLDRVQGPDYGYDTFFASVDTLVIGRATYDTVLGFGNWPYAGKRVIVMTHRPAAPRRDETFTSATPRELLAQLRDSRRIYVDGGNVIRQFLAAGAIDDLTLSIVPIVLGEGIRLFASGEGEHALVLDSSQAWPTGLVQLRYRLARRAELAGREHSRRACMRMRRPG